MIKCPKCEVVNDEDALFCKKCAFPLDENPKYYNEPVKIKYKKKKPKTKIKTKIKYKKQKGQMNFFQKFIMFLLFVLLTCALALAAFLGYYIYQNSNIKVPNVIGYTYETANKILKNENLQAEKIEKIVEDKNKVGIVINQNKKEGNKVMKNTIIKLTIGVLDTKITVPNLTGKTLEDAIKILNEKNIKYKIKYEKSDKDNIVIKQNIKENTKIENTKTLIITVSKLENKDENQKEETNNKIEENYINEPTI